MVFSSAVFLFAFLPLTIFGYFLLPRKWRNAYLMLASLVFYAWGEPKFVLVMIASILMNYLFGLLVVKKEDEACRKRILVLTVIANLSLLFVFKYLNFTVANLNVQCTAPHSAGFSGPFRAPWRHRIHRTWPER